MNTDVPAVMQASDPPGPSTSSTWAAETSDTTGADDLASQPGSLTSVLDGHPLSQASSSSSEDLDFEFEQDRGWRPSEADFAAAHRRPVLVAAHPGLPDQRIQPGVDRRNLPFNDGMPIEIETPLFSGRAVVWLRGGCGDVPGSPAAAQFAGRHRRSLVTVQGRFRRPVALDDLVTGQEFGRVENLPAAWLVEGVLLRVARAVSPSMAIGPLSAPSLLMPVVSGCSEMHAAQPGHEPDPAGLPTEDLRAWDASLVTADGAPLPAAKRKAHFSRPANRAGRTFPTDLVFTFYFYQHVVDLSSYELDVVYKFDLCKYLAGQPLQLMMRTLSSGEYAYCLHVWHERLLARRKGRGRAARMA